MAFLGYETALVIFSCQAYALPCPAGYAVPVQALVLHLLIVFSHISSEPQDRCFSVPVYFLEIQFCQFKQIIYQFRDIHGRCKWSIYFYPSLTMFSPVPAVSADHSYRGPRSCDISMNMRFLALSILIFFVCTDSSLSAISLNASRICKIVFSHEVHAGKVFQP